MTRFGKLAVATGAALIWAVGCISSSAQAAPGVNIDHVEVASDGTVLAVLGVDTGTQADLSSLKVTVDGRPVTATAKSIAQGDVRRTTVLAIDASDSMRGPRIAAAKAAALAFLDAAPDDVRIGLVTFADKAQQVVAPTTDHAALTAAINAIRLTGGTHVYDAIKAAIASSGSAGARSVLLLSDGRDQGGGATLPDAVAAATDAGTVIDVVALDEQAAERAAFGRVADASGGDVVNAAEPQQLESLFTAQANALAHQVLLTFPRPDGVGREAQLQVSLVTGGKTVADAAFVPLGKPSATGASPRTIEGKAPLVGPIALLLGAGALGVGLAGVLAVVLTGGRRRSAAEQRIAAYLQQEPTPATSSTDGLRATAVSAAERVTSGDYGTRLAQRLSAAAVSFTPAEWTLVHAGVAVVAAVVGFVLGGPVLMLLLLGGGIAGPPMFLRFKQTRRLRAFAAQLPETLTLMSGGLSAGLSMAQAVDTVVREGQEPMAGELRRALAEHRLGVGIEDALDGVASRMGSEDFEWVVMAVRIQREVGGNLVEILTTVSDTLREREYLRRQVLTLSAEGRLSAWILGLLPVVMFAYMLIGNRDFVRPLYTVPLGMAFLGAAALMLAIGVFVMSRMVKVEV